MFGPYRTPPELPAEEDVRPEEERVLGWAMLVLGLVRVVTAITAAEVWGFEATVAAAMVVCGGAVLRRT